MIDNNDLWKDLESTLLDNENNENVKENVSSNLLDDDLLEGDGVTSLDEIRDQEASKWKINKVLYIIVFFLVFVLVLVWWVYYFLKLSSSDSKLEWYDKDYMDTVDKYIIQNISENTLNLSAWSINSKNVSSLKQYINDKGVFFYKKQDFLQKYLKEELSKLKRKSKEIESIKKTLVKYRFLPKELSDILKDIKITPILLTLNSIKLYVTDYVYLRTWKFDEYILSYVKKYNPSYSKLDSKLNWKLGSMIKEDIENLRELWVKTYLSDIVFNYMYVDPNKFAKVDKFANNYFINNFYNNYKLVIDSRYKKVSKINPKIKKEDFIASYIMILADVYNRTNDLFNTLDSSALPVDINLLNYDPEDQTLSFNVKISLKEWESRISVVKLATDIITLLRESRLIIWSNINFNNLKVDKLVVRTPNWKKVYDTTNLIFKTSVQNNINVEVTDVVIDK